MGTRRPCANGGGTGETHDQGAIVGIPAFRTGEDVNGDGRLPARSTAEAVWSSDILAFAGPTRPVTAATPGLIWLPPAAAGDMLAAGKRSPCTMVLIDGLMETRMPPMHKEILALLSDGFRVIGAASMGALRAAELAPLGMLGVGHIFAAYRQGRLVADDEVAVLHAPPELGWRPLTEAMVDIRATLAAAVRARIIPLKTAHLLRQAAIADNFRERGWQRLLDTPDLALDDRQAMLRWLPSGRVALKQADADAAIALARALSATPAPRLPAPPETVFLGRLRTFAGTGTKAAAP